MMVSAYRQIGWQRLKIAQAAGVALFGRFFVVAAPEHLGQGNGSHTPFFMPDSVAFRAVIDADQDCCSRFEKTIGTNAHASPAEVEHLCIAVMVMVEMAAHHRPPIVKACLRSFFHGIPSSKTVTRSYRLTPRSHILRGRD